MKSDEELAIDEMVADFANRRETERAAWLATPQPDGPIPQTVAEIQSLPTGGGVAREPRPARFSPLPAADDGAREQEAASREAAAKAATFNANVATNLAKLRSDRGERYRQCTLANFDCTTSPQTLVVERLRSFAANIAQHAGQGEGVFLFGACGTGKDHLAMALASAFIRATGQRVAWVCGAMLFQQLRDSFDGKKSEAEVVGQYRIAPLLWLSDPLPVKGELTQFQAESLYGVIEARYNARRPTIVTANIEPGQADATFGPAIARRLRDATTAFHCNWPPFRN